MRPKRLYRLSTHKYWRILLLFLNFTDYIWLHNCQKPTNSDIVLNTTILAFLPIFFGYSRGWKEIWIINNHQLLLQTIWDLLQVFVISYSSFWLAFIWRFFFHFRFFFVGSSVFIFLQCTLSFWVLTEFLVINMSAQLSTCNSLIMSEHSYFWISGLLVTWVKSDRNKRIY